MASTSFHAPAMLAKQAATVDAISGPAHRGPRRGLEPAGVRRIRLRLRPARVALRGGAGDHRAAAAGGAHDVPRRFYDVDDCVLDPRPARRAARRSCSAPPARGCCGIGLPVVDSWNVWWSIYDNSVERFAQVKAQVDAVTPGGVGSRPRRPSWSPCRAAGALMGERYDTEVTTVTPDDLSEHVRGLAAAGARHLQLVLDGFRNPTRSSAPRSSNTSSARSGRCRTKGCPTDCHGPEMQRGVVTVLGQKRMVPEPLRVLRRSPPSLARGAVGGPFPRLHLHGG